jgi:hypothetical protein
MQDEVPKIDAVVPFHPRDEGTLNWCVQGIRNHLDVARILVVCNREYRPQVEGANAVFFDEDTVVEGLTARSFPHMRWGWYFQQILKLGMADRVETEYYLVIDADTVFLNPVSFFSAAGKPLYATASECHRPYFHTFEQLLGFKADREYSFVAHHMVFNRHIVREMRQRFRRCSPWFENIVQCMDSSSNCGCFSEYETYGHYVKAVHLGEIQIRPLKWINVPLSPSHGLFQYLSRCYDYCSLHAYMRGGGSLARRAWRRTRFELKMMKAQLEVIGHGTDVGRSRPV